MRLLEGTDNRLAFLRILLTVTAQTKPVEFSTKGNLMSLRKKVLTLTAATALCVGGGLASAEPASAASITCGQAVYDPAHEAVVHSCDGTGLIQYTIDCTWPPDVSFTYRWESSASRLLPYTCDGRGEWSVSYKIIE